MLPITVCIICKNEEQHIGECLRRLSAYNIPVVVTDTGSSDRTVEIAQSYTEEVYHFLWCDDFSAARNYCADKAKTDWIWIIDADEYLEEYDENSLFCLLKDACCLGVYRIRSEYEIEGVKDVSTEYLTRIYNKTTARYVGSVHEHLESICDDKVLKRKKVNILFEHKGYITSEIIKMKSERNIDILVKMLKEEESPYVYYQLGNSYFNISDYSNAITFFEKGLEFDLNISLQYVKNMVTKYGYSLLYLQRYEDALGFESIYDEFATNADFVFLMGLIYMNNGMFDDAISEFLKATDYNESIVAGVNSYKAFYNAAVIEECRGNIVNAKALYMKCDGYMPASKRLKQL